MLIYNWPIRINQWSDSRSIRALHLSCAGSTGIPRSPAFSPSMSTTSALISADIIVQKGRAPLSALSTCLIGIAVSNSELMPALVAVNA
jgi:hypothetical protein